MKSRWPWVLVAAMGCGSSETRPAPSGDLDTIELAPAPGWPAGVEARSVPVTFRTSVTGLEIDPAGKVWLLRDAWSDPSDLRGVPVLERYAPSGHLERRITFAANAGVSSFVVHPSGELSVFVMRDDDGDSKANDPGSPSRDVHGACPAPPAHRAPPGAGTPYSSSFPYPERDVPEALP